MKRDLTSALVSAPQLRMATGDDVAEKEKILLWKSSVIEITLTILLNSFVKQ